MTVKIIVMVKRKSGLTPEEFRNGYEESHSRIAVRLFGHLWSSYCRNYVVSASRFADGDLGRARGADELGFDAISEFVLSDIEHLEEMGRIAKDNAAVLAEDEALWFDQVHSWTVTVDTVEEDLQRVPGE